MIAVVASQSRISMPAWSWHYKSRSTTLRNHASRFQRNVSTERDDENQASDSEQDSEAETNDDEMLRAESSNGDKGGHACERVDESTLVPEGGKLGEKRKLAVVDDDDDNDHINKKLKLTEISNPSAEVTTASLAIDNEGDAVGSGTLGVKITGEGSTMEVTSEESSVREGVSRPSSFCRRLWTSYIVM